MQKILIEVVESANILHFKPFSLKYFALCALASVEGGRHVPSP